MSSQIFHIFVQYEQPNDIVILKLGPEKVNTSN